MSYPSYQDLDSFGEDTDDSLPEIDWRAKYNDASESAKKAAMVAWCEYHSQDQDQLEHVPAGLKRLFPDGFQ